MVKFYKWLSEALQHLLQTNSGKIGYFLIIWLVYWYNIQNKHASKHLYHNRTLSQKYTTLQHNFGMVKHFELGKFIEKLVFFVIFKIFWPSLHHYGFQIKTFLQKMFLRTPPNRKYSIINNIIVQNQIISSSLKHM